MVSGIQNNDAFTELASDAVASAQRLLGCTLERTIHNTTVQVKIVETEAYDQTDVASHSYRGETERTRVMFGSAGHLYVYFTYGMHNCCNIVVGPPGHGAAVLIRAVEVLNGQEALFQNRKAKSGFELTNGPAKLCQALAINKSLNGHDLQVAPLVLRMQKPVSPSDITQTTRIGISSGKDMPWRFYITGNPYVSHT